MLKNAKRKGTAAEHRAIRLLEALGYACTRAAASLGAWDVIAIGPRDVRLVQVKCNRWSLSVETELLEAFPCPPGVSREIWRFDDRRREPRVRLVGRS